VSGLDSDSVFGLGIRVQFCCGPLRANQGIFKAEPRGSHAGKFMQHDFIMTSKTSVIKSKMGIIKSKIGRKFEQKRKAKWVKEKANLVKA